MVKLNLYIKLYILLQSKLIPILEPEYVAERAVSGILTNREVVMVPGWCALLVAIKVKVVVMVSGWCALLVTIKVREVDMIPG